MGFQVLYKPTLTGGTEVELSTTGMVGGKASYAFPGGDRLNGAHLSITTSTKGSKAAPVASTGVHLTDTRVTESEACCSVSAPTVVFDTGVRFGALDGLTTSQITDSVDRFRAVINSQEFLTAVLTGAIPG